MSAIQEKAAGVFGVPEAAHKGSDASSIGNTHDNDKRLRTLKAEFALRGHSLHVDHRAGRELFVVSRWGQSRTFSHLGDVEAFLRQIGRPITADPIASFTAAMSDADMKPPASIAADGRLHMFSPDGDGTPRDGWYLLRLEGDPGGAFGCERKGVALAWGPGGTKPASKDHRECELSNLRAQMDAFSSGIVSAGERSDALLTPHFALPAIRAAERIVELGGTP